MQAYAVNDLAISLIAGIGRLDFQDRLTQSLKQCIKIEAGLILLYRRDSAPKILFNDWRTHRGLLDIQHYLEGPYRQDPFYQLAFDNEDDGLYRLSQIAPNDFSRSAYYTNYYRHSGLVDEFNFLISLDTQTKVAISVCRSQSNPRFSSDEADMLNSVSSLLQSAVIRHWRDLRPELLDDDGGMLQKALARAINNFGRSILTERECEVAQLVLRGYSLKGAADLLGISPATVKLHRRNLYAKLDVNSQTELFSLFIDAVSVAKNHYEDPLAGYVTRRQALTGELTAV